MTVTESLIIVIYMWLLWAGCTSQEGLKLLVLTMIIIIIIIILFIIIIIILIIIIIIPSEINTTLLRLQVRHPADPRKPRNRNKLQLFWP